VARDDGDGHRGWFSDGAAVVVDHGGSGQDCRGLVAKVTTADVASLLSRVGKERPELMNTRDGRLLVEAILEEARKLPVGIGPIAPVDDPNGV
jgi:hypothetical protein